MILTGEYYLDYILNLESLLIFFIYHTTKEGKFRGVNAHAHEVDVIIEVEKGKATSTGRFNAGRVLEIKI